MFPGQLQPQEEFDIVVGLTQGTPDCKKVLKRRATVAGTRPPGAVKTLLRQYE
jgi:hypothetical protein